MFISIQTEQWISAKFKKKMFRDIWKCFRPFRVMIRCVIFIYTWYRWYVWCHTLCVNWEYLQEGKLTWKINNESLSPVSPTSLLVLPGESMCPLGPNLQIHLGLPLSLPAQPMAQGAHNSATRGTILLLQTARRIWGRQSILSPTPVDERNWGFPKPFGK